MWSRVCGAYRQLNEWHVQLSKWWQTSVMHESQIAMALFKRCVAGVNHDSIPNSRVTKATSRHCLCRVATRPGRAEQVLVSRHSSNPDGFNDDRAVSVRQPGA